MDRPILVPGKGAPWFGTFALAGLVVTSLHSYLLFHSIAEMFFIVIACGIFMLAWNSRHLLDNDYFLFLGIAFLFVAGMDLLHTLAFKGMGVFPDDANLPTQLWIASRYLESVSFLIAPLFLSRRLNSSCVFAAYGVICLLLLTSIFYWDIFPDCFVENAGLTKFKITSEVIICLIFAAAAALLWRRRRQFEPGVFRLLLASILVTICSELAFTLYTDVYGVFNLLGHLLEFLSSYIIYRAIIQTGLIRPVNLLFRNLKLSEQRLYSLLEEMPAFVYLQSSDHRIRFANRRFRELFGSPDGKKCHELLFGSSEPCRDCPTWRVLQTGRPQQREWVRSELEVYQLYEYPFSDELDEKPQALVLGIDITERKNAEEALRKAHDELETRVQARTTELMMANQALQLEIAEREAIEEALRESEKELQVLSARLLVAQEEERKRIAMELHDSIGASLAAVKFGMENALVRSMKDLSEATRDSLTAMVPMVQSAVDEVRRIHSGIWPSVLDDLGIVAAIGWLCRNYQNTYPQIQILAEVNVNEEQIGESLKIVIYRILQEALNNVAKHSRASTVQMSLRHVAGAIELVIKDNGIGFGMQSGGRRDVCGAGVGLSSMKERARLSGGVFEITSTPGGGATVRATWPLHQKMTENDAVA